MDRRFFSFLVLAMAIMVGWQIIAARLFPPPPKPEPAAGERAAAHAEGEKPADAPQKEPEKKPDGAAQAKPAAKPAPPAVAEAPEAAPAWATLGSLDPQSPYRMLVTFGNRGAAVLRVELNDPRYYNVDNIRPLGGYLGHLEATDAPGGKGCVVNVVGPGTPAEKAKLQVGDIVTAVNDQPAANALEFDDLMRKTKPGAAAKLAVVRDGKPATFDVTLASHPLEVVHREASDPAQLGALDPASFLLTLDRVGDEMLDLDGEELPGVNLREAHWELLPADPAKPNEVAFRRVLPRQQVEIVKRYELLTVDNAAPDARARPFTLVLKVEVKNLADAERKLAYRLDGPTGLPVEGYWYARSSKIGAESGCGMRDVVHGLVVEGRVEDGMHICKTIADGEAAVIADAVIKYVGVDSQYFAAILLPQQQDEAESRFVRVKPMRAGPVPPGHPMLTNVTFRMARRPVEAAPGAAAISDEFKIYLGPKAPEILADYGLDPLVDYGWFDWVAKPMLAIMHFFYSIVGNYGIAIILLTVVVRSAMFPLSRKQALNAMKMQELQPEIKAIAEKYKKSPEQRMKAQQELFRKHNYNPFSGCLPIFIQLPIFIGLYRSLAVDVELRQAPLITEGIRWASNLAAPDMFWYWQPYLPAFLAGEDGFLGPFLNLLPLATIVLFLVQQKMFMPPPTDEQSAMQQKMMKYMMIFMGFLFFKVPAGLCVYFITSSLWSIAERKMLPKAKPADPMSQAVVNVVPRSAGGDRKAKRR